MRNAIFYHSDALFVERVEAVVRERIAWQAAGIVVDHVMRVLSSARVIQAEAGGDLRTVESAALLPGFGDASFHDGVERCAELARGILARFLDNRFTWLMRATRKLELDVSKRN